MYGKSLKKKGSMHSDDCDVIIMATYTDIYIKVDVTMNGEEKDGEYATITCMFI